MPRSERCASGAIASTVSPCLPWRKLLSLTERLPLVEAPVAGAERLALVERPWCRAACRAPSKEAIEGRQGGHKDRGEGIATRLSSKTIGAGPAARLLRPAARAGYGANPIACCGGFGGFLPSAVATQWQ
jgi:hypothetical protein